MNFKLEIPTLENLCRVQIVCHLFNNKMKMLTSHFPEFSPITNLTKEYENSRVLQLSVVKDVEKLKAPRFIKLKILHTIYNCYFHPWRWSSYCIFIKSTFKVPRMGTLTQIYLHPDGRLDESRMLNEYILRMSSTIYLSTDEVYFWFKIASEWCLLDSVVRLWSIMTENERRNISSKYSDNMLMAFWLNYCGDGSISVLENFRRDKTKNIYLSLLEYSFCSRLKHAVMYLLQKLKEDEKEAILPKFICFALRERMPELLRWSFARLAENYFENYVRCYGFEVLECFINFSDLKYFACCLETAMQGIRFKSYVYILKELIKKVKFFRYLEDMTYEKVLQQFWSKSPPHYKIYVTEKKSFKNFVKEFILQEEPSIQS